MVLQSVLGKQKLYSISVVLKTDRSRNQWAHLVCAPTDFWVWMSPVCFCFTEMCNKFLSAVISFNLLLKCYFTCFFKLLLGIYRRRGGSPLKISLPSWLEISWLAFIVKIFYVVISAVSLFLVNWTVWYLEASKIVLTWQVYLLANATTVAVCICLPVNQMHNCEVC